MKKLTWASHILAALMMILVVAGALCGAVANKAFDPLLYGSESRAAVMDAMGFTSEEEVTAYIGLDWQAQDDLAGRISISMRLEHAEFDMEELNEKEQQHMRDVRDLILLAQKVSQSCMTLAAALAVVIAWTGAKDKRRGMPLGALAGLGIVLLIAMIMYVLMNTQGFEQMFVWMHELLFANGLWLLDPGTDILIRMMPQLLFERAAENVIMQAVRSLLITWAMLLVLYHVMMGMIRRHTK